MTGTDDESQPSTLGELMNDAWSRNIAAMYRNIAHMVFYNNVTVALVLLALSMLAWDRWLNTTRDKTCPLPLPPGFMGLPFAGNTPFVVLEPFVGNVFELCNKIFGGSAYKLHIVGQPTIRLVQPEHCDKVFNSNDVKPTWPYTFRVLMGDGANSQSTGTVHKMHRRVVMRAFTPQALRAYAGPMQRGCRAEIIRWRDAAAPVNVFMESKVLAFKIAWELLVGVAVVGPSADQLTKSFMDFVGGFIAVPIKVPGTSFYKACKAKTLIHDYIGKAIENIKLGKSERSDCALNLILSNTGEDQAMGDMSEQAIKDLVTEMLFAGHETISSVFTSATMHLYNNPEYLAKLRESLEKEGLMTADRDDDLTMERVSKCQYAEDVFKEIVRYTPPVQGVFRRATKTMEVDKYQVPAGWSVMAGIMEIHRFNSFYDQPQTFNPDRWETLRDKTGELRKHFLPFGAGAHTCMGKEYAKLMGVIFMIELVRLCDWTIKEPNPSCTYIPSFRPRDGLPTRFYAKGYAEGKKER